MIEKQMDWKKIFTDHLVELDEQVIFDLHFSSHFNELFFLGNQFIHRISLSFE